MKHIIPRTGYYINMNDYPERNVSFMDEAKKADFFDQIIRFSAVDGRKDVEELMKKFKTFWQDRNEGTSKGQLGCALSHLCLLKKCIDENMDEIFILEDDCIFTKGFKEKIHVVERNTKIMNKYDIILLGNQHSLPRLMISNLIIKLRHDLFVTRVPSFCTHAMIVTNEGCRKILKYIEKHGLWVYDIILIEMMKAGKLNAISVLQPNQGDSEHPVYNERSSGLVYQRKDLRLCIHLE